MAPEFFPRNLDFAQVKYKRTVDVYSLGMIIYLIYTEATSKTFYEGITGDELMINKSLGHKPKMDLLNTNRVPPNVAPLIDRTVDSDPRHRPSLCELGVAVATSTFVPNVN